LSTRVQLRLNVRANLSDSGITFYDDNSINNALQDAYNEVAAKARCITKSATVNQVANANYYDFISLGVTDYLGTTAIFNLDTNFWLRDDVSLRDFDRLRRDWEMWNGSCQFWAPHSLQYIAVAPVLPLIVAEQFTLLYWAAAPTLTSDSSVPLVSTDMQPLLEYYATADLLESAEEMTKAQPYWESYRKDLPKYKKRCVQLAAADLLLRV
jgi:hypothetical protein